MCLYSKRAIELPIHILPVDDQPIIEEPRIYFPPIPNRLDSTYEDGVPASILMKADPSVVRKLMFGKKNDKLRDIMAKGKKHFWNMVVCLFHFRVIINWNNTIYLETILLPSFRISDPSSAGGVRHGARDPYRPIKFPDVFNWLWHKYMSVKHFPKYL